jgi:hypothetical protein
VLLLPLTLNHTHTTTHLASHRIAIGPSIIISMSRQKRSCNQQQRG